MEDLQPGDPATVGGYRLVGRIGAGGMGQVFLGVSPGGRKVAVKLIHPMHAGTGQFRERFAREIEAARLVGGFYTATVVDADPHADPPWMVTSYIDGPSLQDVIDQDGPLPPDQVRSLGAGLAEGLAAIHACGLVHRDLKPGNVILAGDGPRIIDFGIARRADSTVLTTAGSVVGTYAYMSPEQIRGESVGPASDVFSLGGVLAFVATGRPPFAGDAPATVMFGIATEPPGLDGLVDTGLREVILACLAKVPQARRRVGAVLAALSSTAPGSVAPVPAGPAEPTAVTAADRVVDTAYSPASPAASAGQWPHAQTSTAPRMAPPEHPPSTTPAQLPLAPPPPANKTRRRMAAIATVAIAAVLAVILPVLLSNSRGSASGQNKTAAVSHPTAAARPDAVGKLSAKAHAINAATGYNGAIHVDFTVPQPNSAQLSSVQYGLNSATVSGTWLDPGVPGSRVEKSIIGLSNGTTYTVYVRGCNSAGRCGPWTGPSNKVTPYGPPRAPNISARANGTSITYSWSGGGGNGRPVSSYLVCFDGSSCTRNEVGSITISYGQGQTHTITAYVIDSAGQHSATASTSATTAAGSATPTAPFPMPSQTCPPGDVNVNCTIASP